MERGNDSSTDRSSPPTPTYARILQLPRNSSLESMRATINSLRIGLSLICPSFDCPAPEGVNTRASNIPPTREQIIGRLSLDRSHQGVTGLVATSASTNKKFKKKKKTTSADARLFAKTTQRAIQTGPKKKKNLYK